MFTVPIYPFSGSKERVIKSIKNNIAETKIVIWLKIFPQPPQRYRFQTFWNEDIPIPTIDEQQELMGTHLELRIMTKNEDNVVARVLIWQKAGHLCFAMPNDKERDIDNLEYDLDSTKHIIKMERPVHLSLKTVKKHYFLSYGEETIAIESFYK